MFSAIRGLLGVLIFWLSAGLAQAQTSDDGYRVFRPEGPGPHPAVAFVSGCSGFRPTLAPKAYERVAEKLREQGYLVLFVDYVGRRGVANCTRGPIAEADAAKDLVTAVTWLRSQPSVDRTRISALGWSYGGGAVLVALADYTEQQLGLSRAIVHYPICRAVRPWRVAIPVLILFAGDDEVAPSKVCQSAVLNSAMPDLVKTVTYHGALHTFDVPELPTEMVGPAGMMGYNARAAEAAWREVQEFLQSSK